MNSKPEILIIDNDIHYAERLTHILGESFTFLMATKRDDYLGIIKEKCETLKLIIMDIGDSRDNGYMDLKMLNEAGVVNKHPILIMSAEEDDFDLENAFSLGAYEFTYKYCAGSIIKNRVSHLVNFYSSKIVAAREEAKTANSTGANEQEVDPLTKCLRYEGFSKKFREITDSDPNKQYGVVFYDIDNLTYINSVYGYKVGDELLRVIGETSNEIAKGHGCVTRISEDRFAMFYDLAEVLKMEIKPVQKIELVVNQYMTSIELNHMVRIYGGIYRLKPEDLEKKTLAQIVDCAITAHKEIKKKKNSPICYYDDEFVNKQKRINLLIDSLNYALEQGEVVPWYQPQIDCRNGNIVGAEVLCRWFSKKLGFVSPGEFIPVFEESGQVCKLDQYIWEAACKQICKWKKENKPVIPLSINVSRKEMIETDLETILPEMIKKYEVTPDQLRIEITESAYMDEPDKLISMVNKLKGHGFTVEMDDFGSGYSSLNMLKDVPVDVLKLDMRFLSGSIDENSNSGGSIISSIIRMANGMNLDVIAEGVETKEQCVSLRNMGCSIIQGYYYAKPMGIEEFEEYISCHQVGTMSENDISDEMRYLHNLMDHTSVSSHIFDNYIGTAAILELTGDHVEVLKINEKFMDEMCDKEKESLKYMSDGNTLVADEDKPKVIQSLEYALKHGEATLETYLPFTGQWVKLLYRLLFVGPVSSYYFCEITNTTDKHILGNQFQQYVDVTESTMEAIPSGVFKYEADGEQKFSYISRSLLWMLGYKTREEFLIKFDNRFPNMIYHEDRERVLGDISNQISDSQKIDYCEYRVECADGTLKTLSDYGHLVEDPDGKRWFYVVVSDADFSKKKD